MVDGRYSGRAHRLGRDAVFNFPEVFDIAELSAMVTARRRDQGFLCGAWPRVGCNEHRRLRLPRPANSLSSPYRARGVLFGLGGAQRQAAASSATPSASG